MASVTTQGTVPYPTTADSTPLHEFAGNLASLAERLDHAAGRLSTAQATATSSWSGTAATAFDAHLEQRMRSMANVAAACADAVPILRAYAATIDSTQSAYVSAVAAEYAARGGLPYTAAALAAALGEETAAVTAQQAAGATGAASLTAIAGTVAFTELVRAGRQLASEAVAFDDTAVGATLTVTGDGVVIPAPGTVEVNSTTRSASGSIEIGVKAIDVKISADGRTKIIEYADGSARLEVTVTGEAAISLLDKTPEAGRLRGVGAELDAGLGATVTRVYQFTSRDDAERVERGLRAEVIPTPTELVVHTVSPLSTVGSDAAADGARYLADYDDQLVTTRVSGQKVGGVDVRLGPVGTVELSGENGVEYDSAAGTTTFYSERAGAGALEFGIRGAVDGEFKTEMVTRDLQADEFKVSGSFTHSGGIGTDEMANALFVEQLPVDAGATAGKEYSFEASVDLTDADNARLYTKYQLARNTGNGAAAAVLLDELIDRSNLLVQVGESAEVSAGVDVVVAEGEISQTESTTQWSGYRGSDGTWHPIDGGD